MAEAQDHDVVQQGAVELDIQQVIRPHQIVGGGQRLPPGTLHGGFPIGDPIGQEHVIPLAQLVPQKTLGFVHQVGRAANAAADIVHALALAGIIRGQYGIKGSIQVALGL